MANEKYLALLKEALEKGDIEIWNKWRKKNPSVMPNLSGAILKEMNLKNAILSEADLSSANMRGANLSGAILKGANLSGAILFNANMRLASLSFAKVEDANMGGANLFDADLTNSNMKGADLRESNMYGSTLRSADFAGANLTDSNLRGANLTDANLGCANLSGVNLRGADLKATDFSQSEIGWTTFANNDLSMAKGLDTVIHRGPSTIGIDTIHNSQGKIPEVFLRGTGVPEAFILYQRSLIKSSDEFYSCFISYSHEDKSFARRLHDRLQEKRIRCWMDEKQILPGEKIFDAVDRGIRFWDKILLCCSKKSLASWWVDNEIDTAFAKEQELWKERKESIYALIPLNLDGFMFSKDWKSGKAEQIKSRLAADFTGWETNHNKFEEQLERVVLALRTQRPAEMQVPASRL
jgi:uncharacterized protein YjbI with pentapeptide repeats